MAAKIIDGKVVANAIKEELAEEVGRLVGKAGRPPGLAVVLVGSHPASEVYVRNKRRTCEKLGIYAPEHTYGADLEPKKLFKLVEELNRDERIDGILVQSPLPEGFDEFAVVESIDPEKDVDGFHPVNVGKLLIGKECFVSCTPLGVQVLLLRYGIETSGKHVVIVGRSNIVGKPLASLLMQKKTGANATVTVCHSRTKDLPSLTRKADIVVAAIGVPEFIKGDMVSDGAVVVDVGINRVDDPTREKGYRIVGDVDFAAVSWRRRRGSRRYRAELV